MPTNYAGESYRIETRDELDFDGAALSPDVVSSVQVQVFDSELTAPPVVDELMEYNEDIGHWVYTWDTNGVVAGTYKAFITFNFASGDPSIEGPIRIRLKRDPRP